jgi:hypothetical protein
MFKILAFACVSLSFVCFPFSPRAGTVTGRILCDANTNMVADPGDAGISGVMVIVVSEAGGFSNSAVTLGDGSFSMSLPDFDASAYRRDPLSQSYIERLAADTLPADAVVLVPQPALGTNPVYYITPAIASNNTPISYISLAGSSTNGDWLISSVSCQAEAQSNSCSISGSGTIRGTTKHVEDSFGGNVSPNGKNGLPRGKWMHEARTLNLRFESKHIDAVACAAGAGGGSAIEFSGRGTLTSGKGKKAAVTPALFFVHAEDAGKPKAGKDAYYIRVYNQAGDTLLLVSGDSGNPENVVPVPISKGNLRIKTVQ